VRSPRVGTLVTRVCPAAIRRAFVIGEEERPVVHQRPAQRAAELVALVLWRRLIGRREKVVTTERAVAEEIVSSAMELVAAGARDHADLAARVSAETGIISGSCHFELADGVHGRRHAGAVQLGVAIVGAIQQEVVGVLARSVDADGKRAADRSRRAFGRRRDPCQSRLSW